MILTVLEAWALRKVCLKLNRTTLTPPTTFHANDGSVQGLNRGNDMKGQTHGGKGSATRKTDSAKFASNWDAIYNKPAKKSSKKKK